MHFLIVLALTLTSCIALPSSKEIKSRNIIIPAGRPEGRITNGKDAEKKQFPYMVSVRPEDEEGYAEQCGGSLLNHEWVLTAAHCLMNVTQATVDLGITNLLYPEVQYEVTSANFAIHEDYVNASFNNDIALIKIPYTEFSDNIQPVKLPAISKSYASYTGDAVIATGWGRTTDLNNDTTDRLQWARLTVIPNKICSKNWNIFYYSSYICTSTINGVNTCDGDSGGPIVLESSKVQIGLTAFGSGYCTQSKPSLYTRVTSFLPWIKKHTKASKTPPQQHA